MAIKTVQAIINGQTYDLQLNSVSGKYEATVTAPSKSSYNQTGHFYDVTLKATDDAGNSVSKNASDPTIGGNLKLFVKEKVAPTQSITYPTSNALITNNRPVITWEVKDNDSGVNPSTIAIQIDSGNKITEGITKAPITGGYKCTYTPVQAIGDGQHTIKITSADFDGNASAVTQVQFKIDTVPPQLNISTPIDGIKTNKSALTIEGTTNDITSSPVTVTVKLNTGGSEKVTVQSNGQFTHSLTLVEGLNTITVVATDSAGKSSTIVRKVTLDTKPPVFNTVTITPNPVDAGKTFVISIDVTDA